MLSWRGGQPRVLAEVGGRSRDSQHALLLGARSKGRGPRQRECGGHAMAATAAGKGGGVGVGGAGSPSPGPPGGLQGAVRWRSRCGHDKLHHHHFFLQGQCRRKGAAVVQMLFPLAVSKPEGGRRTDSSASIRSPSRFMCRLGAREQTAGPPPTDWPPHAPPMLLPFASCPPERHLHPAEGFQQDF